MTAADPRALAAQMTGRERAEHEAREIAIREIVSSYGVSREKAERMLEASLAAPMPKAPLRCRLGLHKLTSGVTIAEAGAGVVISEHHGPIATPPFRLVGRTCERCPAVRFDVRGAS